MASSIVSAAVAAALRVLKQSYAPLQDDHAHKTLFRGAVLDAKLCFHVDEEKEECFRTWDSGVLVLAKVLDSYVLMLHPDEGSEEISQSRVLSPSDELVITFRQANLTISAEASGRNDGRLQIVAKDHGTFWAIVICLAQYHLDVLCRRSALESQIDLLRHQELNMKYYMMGAPSAPPHRLRHIYVSVVFALLSGVAVLIIVLTRTRAETGYPRIIA